MTQMTNFCKKEKSEKEKSVRHSQDEVMRVRNPETDYGDTKEAETFANVRVCILRGEVLEEGECDGGCVWGPLQVCNKQVVLRLSNA